jgi:hypothetical protein
MERRLLKPFRKIESKRIITRKHIFLAVKIIFLVFLIFYAWHRNK